jgi:hypothetical protein
MDAEEGKISAREIGITTEALLLNTFIIKKYISHTSVEHLHYFTVDLAVLFKSCLCTPTIKHMWLTLFTNIPVSVIVTDNKPSTTIIHFVSRNLITKTTKLSKFYKVNSFITATKRCTCLFSSCCIEQSQHREPLRPGFNHSRILLTIHRHKYASHVRK